MNYFICVMYYFIQLYRLHLNNRLTQPITNCLLKHFNLTSKIRVIWFNERLITYTSKMQWDSSFTWWMDNPCKGFSLDFQLRQDEACNVRLGVHMRWSPFERYDPVLLGTHASLHDGWFIHVKASCLTFSFIETRRVITLWSAKKLIPFWNLVFSSEASMLLYIVNGLSM